MIFGGIFSGWSPISDSKYKDLPISGGSESRPTREIFQPRENPMKVALKLCPPIGWNFELAYISRVSHKQLIMATHLFRSYTFRYLKQSQEGSPAQNGNVLPTNIYSIITATMEAG